MLHYTCILIAVVFSDMLFSESQMLAILRSVPVGRYLQPSGNWKDGLDMPFVFVRDEIYFGISVGGNTLRNGGELND